MEESSPLITTGEAARRLGISRRALALYAKTGVLRPTLTLPNGHHRWDIDDLIRQLRARNDK